MRLIGPLEFADRFGTPIIGMLAAYLVLVLFHLVSHAPLPPEALAPVESPLGLMLGF